MILLSNTSHNQRLQVLLHNNHTLKSLVALYRAGGGQKNVTVARKKSWGDFFTNPKKCMILKKIRALRVRHAKQRV